VSMAASSARRDRAIAELFYSSGLRLAVSESSW
jgi:site-specific recombinase XerC